MNFRAFKPFALFAAVLLFCMADSTNAATLTVTPSSISNTYAGTILLQVSGLTNNEPVLIQRFFDANTNGVIDSTERLVQNIAITEGRVTAFGGVRDVNVPGDDDGATNGLIQTSFQLKTGAELARVSGNYLLRLSSPSGNFSPVVQSLTVTQSAFAQSVSGQVTSGINPVPGAVVALLIANDHGMDFIAGVAADAAGNFSLNCPPGEYGVVAFADGYVSDLDSMPFVTVNSSQAVTQNVSVLSAPRTVSGNISDANTSQGIPGLQLFVETESGKLAIIVTRTNGDFSGSVDSDIWQVNPSELTTPQQGYLLPRQTPEVDTTTNSVSGVNLQLYKATALIYGYLRNETNAPLPDVQIECNDNANLFETTTRTDANGYYVAGVRADTWTVGAENDSAALGGYFVQGTNVSILTGQAVQANLTATLASAHLRGTIRDDLGNPIANITIVIQPVPIQPGGAGSIYPSTDGTGNFDVVVPDGTWNIALDCGSAQQRNLVNVNNYDVVVTNGSDVNGLILTFPVSTATISGTVTDVFGTPVDGVELDGGSGIYYPGCVTTDSTGYYQIKVINGTWHVSIRGDQLNARGYTTAPSQNIMVSGGSQTAYFVVSPIPPTLSQPRVVSGQFQFNLSGFDVRKYRIESSTNLTTWTILATNQTVGGTLTFSDPTFSPTTRRLYRAKVVE